MIDRDKWSTWSTEPPTKPGWYWWAPSDEFTHGVGICEVSASLFDGALYTRHTNIRAGGYYGRWAGPIALPGEEPPNDGC